MPVKILMADGDPKVLEMAATTMVAVQWCDLVTVDDGVKAAESLQNKKFDGLILADRMPGLDGFELIQRLKDSPLNSSVPIVMPTAEDDVEAMRNGFKAGVTFFAPKPTNRERFYRLFNAVRGAMESERRRHHRLPYRTSVTCKVGDGESHFIAESRDISEGGILLTPSGGAVVGQVLELELLMPQVARPAHSDTRPQRQSIFAERQAALVGPQTVRARVRYIAPAGESMGLDFLSLTPAQRETIQRYIAGAS